MSVASIQSRMPLLENNDNNSNRGLEKVKNFAFNVFVTIKAFFSVLLFGPWKDFFSNVNKKKLEILKNHEPIPESTIIDVPKKSDSNKIYSVVKVILGGAVLTGLVAASVFGYNYFRNNYLNFAQQAIDTNSVLDQAVGNICKSSVNTPIIKKMCDDLEYYKTANTVKSKVGLFFNYLTLNLSGLKNKIINAFFNNAYSPINGVLPLVNISIQTKS